MPNKLVKNLTQITLVGMVLVGAVACAPEYEEREGVIEGEGGIEREALEEREVEEED
ncbi:hypothetical protein [Gloeocapsopsis dulcis]|uniref:hypothetical protein n=1 Tax=Gloeocapsopsis dulcis TaxID=2859516 RepID=UPI0012DAEC0E|nr:hypothetical protein [Gloeocapsopsis dulcis]WNN90037.1 hypothetical protein P0S91_02755 [Gloeocapsopsis dulcis]